MKGLKKVLAMSLALAVVMGAASCDSAEKEKSKSPKETIEEKTDETEQKEVKPENSTPDEPSETSGTNGPMYRRDAVNEVADTLTDITGGTKFTGDPYQYILYDEEPEYVEDGMIVFAQDTETTLYLFTYSENQAFSPFYKDDYENLYMDQASDLTVYLKDTSKKVEVATVGTDSNGDMTVDMGGPLNFFHEEMAVIEYEEEKTANEAFLNYVKENYGKLEMTEEDYKNDPDQGYLVVHYDFEDYLKYCCNEDPTPENIETYKQTIGEFIVVDAIYQSGNKIIKLSYINTIGSIDYCSVEYLEMEGFKNPFEVENSEGLLEYYGKHRLNW